MPTLRTVLVILSVTSCTGVLGTLTPPPPGPPGCGLEQAGFCDTFDTPSPGGRGGDLDDHEWAVARISTMGSKGVIEPWEDGTAVGCGSTITGIIPDNDLFFCAGGGTPSMHFNDVENDGGGFTIHSFRPRRPFDFTGRTGVIAFDVGAKASMPGGHGFWLNITLSEEPVPAPYQEGGQIALFAKKALLIEFAAGGLSQECKADGSRNAVSTVFVEENYRITHEYQFLVDRNAWRPDRGCYTTQEELMNHVEIRVSESSLEVLVSDAGDPTTLRSVVLLNADSDPTDPFHLPFTKGYVNFQQTHYNAAKSGENFKYATYHWDNLGFDGPSYPTPRSYQIPDSLKSYMVDFGGGPFRLTDIGYSLKPNGLEHGGPVGPVTLPNVDLTNATDAFLTLNAWGFCPGEAIGYRFNGGPWRNYDCPFPPAHCGEGCGGGNQAPGDCDHSARAVVIPVALSDLKSGDNTVEINTNHPHDSANNPTDGNPVIFANGELTVNVSQ